MRKPLVLLLESDDGKRAELAALLRAHGFNVEEDARTWGGSPTVVVVVTSNGSVEATCSRLLCWYSALRDGPISQREPRADMRRLVGCSEAMELVRRAIERIAPSPANVLVTGETGTGKELVAELIHLKSGRSGILVPINCAAIPDGLLESELFGYERGAFTGATGSYEGKLRLAHGGTVLLDEIGDMSAYAQAKLLRALETREVYRLGGRRPVALDVRIVAATNADLEARVADGRFRKDLYFRLNVARIHMPPLRERPEDVPVLLQHVRAECPSLVAIAFSNEAIQSLCRYSWPGNVRELRNVVEVMTLGAERAELGVTDLPPALRVAVSPQPAVRGVARADEERARLLAALRTAHWNKSRAAEQLRWSRMTVYRKMAKYQISEAAGGFAEPLPRAQARARP